MTTTEDARPRGDGRGAGGEKVGQTYDDGTHLADSYAWTAVFLGDGRVVSIAWLRGWPGAVAARTGATP